MTWLARFFAAGLTWVITLTLFGLVLVSTEWGLHWTYRTAAVLLPGQLSIAELRGRLLGPLHVRGLRYRHQDTEIALDRLDIDWSPDELAARLLHIRSLTVHNLAINYASTSDDPPTLPDIHLPFRLRIDQAQLSALHLQKRGQATAFELTTASLSTRWERDGGHIQRLEVEGPRFRLSASGDFTPQGDYPLDLQLQWRFDAAEYGVWAGAGRAHGDAKQLRVEQQLASPVTARLTGRVSTPLSALSWDADLSADDFNLRAIHRGWPDLRVGGQLHGRGQGRELHATGRLRTTQKDLRLAHDLDLRYGADTLTINRLHSVLGNTGSAVTVHGRLTGFGKEIYADLNGQWRALRWPLADGPRVQSAQGGFTVSGTQKNYALKLRGEVSGNGIPTGQWRVSGQGTPERLLLSDIQAEILAGRVRGQGEVQWKPTLSWRASWQAQDINPGRQWPDWPGALHFAGNIEGRQRDGVHDLSVNIPAVTGTLLDHPFSGTVSAAMHGAEITLSRFHAQSGENQVNIQGTLGEQWDGHWEITADNLAALLPDTGGTFQGGGQVSGPRHAPVLTSSLIGTNLRYRAYHAGQVQLVMSVDSSGTQPSALEVQAEYLGNGKLEFEHALFRADGNTEQHTLRAAVSGAPGQFEAELSGGYLDSQWRGMVSALNVDHPLSGPWTLASPAPLRGDPKAGHVEFESLCLRQDTGHLCTSAEWNKQHDWHAQASARGLPLSVAQNLLPSGAIITGEVDLDAQVQADQAGIITGRLDARLGAGAISQAVTARENNIGLSFNNARLSGELDREALRLSLGLDLNDGGNFASKLSVQRGALPKPLGDGDDGADSVRGQANIDIRDLSVLPLFIPALENTLGRVSGALQLTGSLAEPKLTGSLQLENGSADLPGLGIHVKDTQIILEAHGRDYFTIDAGLQSPKGRLKLQGETRRLATGDWQTKLSASGKDVEIINSSEMHIIATPDIQLRVLKERVDLEGDILIPRADIRPRQVSGAVSVSDDVVIVNPEGPAAQKSLWQIHSQVRLRLGDFVRFDGFGLRARLAGEIVLNEAPQQPTTAKGELRIVEGEYRAYGQELTIERGRLMFFGGPVDNPGLDVRAVRHVDEVSAGLLVRGTLKTPQVTLFSEPAMAETDALSYLLLGRPVSQASTAEGEEMYGAAAALGLFGGGFLATQLGRQFGIDDVRLEAGGGYGQGAIVIRHYLSPKLYVSYGLGLFENFNVFVVSYQISRLWTLQAESGTHSSADLLYTIERD